MNNQRSTEGTYSKLDLMRAIPDCTYSEFHETADPNVACFGMNRVLTVIRTRHRCACKEDLDNAIEFVAEAKRAYLLMACDAERAISWVKARLPAKSSAALESTELNQKQAGNIAVGIASVLLLTAILTFTAMLLPHPASEAASVAPFTHDPVCMEFKHLVGECHPSGS